MEKKRVEELIRTLREEYSEELLNLSDTLLIVVKLTDGEEVYVKVERSGVTQYGNIPDVANQLHIAYKDIDKVVDSPARLMRFLTTGRVRIKGNIKQVMKDIENLFDE